MWVLSGLLMKSTEYTQDIIWYGFIYLWWNSTYKLVCNNGRFFCCCMCSVAKQYCWLFKYFDSFEPISPCPYTIGENFSQSLRFSLLEKTPSLLRIFVELASIYLIFLTIEKMVFHNDIVVYRSLSVSGNG